jgi:excisionase family DNA binding protein
MNRHPATNTEDSGALSKVAGPADRPGVRPADEDPPADALWTVVDVGRYLRIPPSSIYKMTARHAAVRIPHIHIGGKLRFRRADVDRWLTLLTISNIEVLARVRDRAAKETHGHHSQTAAR